MVKNMKNQNRLLSDTEGTVYHFPDRALHCSVSSSLVLSNNRTYVRMYQSNFLYNSMDTLFRRGFQKSITKKTAQGGLFQNL